MVKFNAKSNPQPSKTTHNTFIEIIWTVVPILDPRGDRYSFLPICSISSATSRKPI